MKTLKYILTGIVLWIAIPYSTVRTQTINEQVITLHCVVKDTPSLLLSESKDILLKRLKLMNLQDYHIDQNDSKSELIVTVRDTIDRQVLSEILVTRGYLNFFETTSSGEIMHDSGRLTPGNLTEGNKTFNEQNIREVCADFTDPKNPVFNLTFKERVWDQWKEFAHKNIGKSIVMVIDEKVYITPRLVNEIPCGKISLTGHGFSKAEITGLVAILSSGVLPLNFEIENSN